MFIFVVRMRFVFMADTHDRATRSYNMSRIKSKNTNPELWVRKYLFSQGFRYRINVHSLPGSPDIVLAKFVSGEAAIVVRGKNIFCSVPRLFPELIKYAAKLGNVHIYTDAPAAVYSNDKYISICATKDGVYPIKFPQKRKIFDIFDKVDLGVSNEISFDMKKGDVKFLRTEPVQ